MFAKIKSLFKNDKKTQQAELLKEGASLKESTDVAIFDLNKSDNSDGQALSENLSGENVKDGKGIQGESESAEYAADVDKTAKKGVSGILGKIKSIFKSNEKKQSDADAVNERVSASPKHVFESFGALQEIDDGKFDIIVGVNNGDSDVLNKSQSSDKSVDKVKNDGVEISDTDEAASEKIEKKSATDDAVLHNDAQDGEKDDKTKIKSEEEV